MHTQALPVERRIAGKEFFEEGRLTDEDQLRRGILGQEGNRGRNNAVGTEVPTHCINRDDWCGQGLLVGALVYYLTAAIEAVRGYVVAQVDFTGALSTDRALDSSASWERRMSRAERDFCSAEQP